MVEASRKQMDDSEGTSSRLISFPSSRSVRSLEKLDKSVKVQKLPRVNSRGTDGEVIQFHIQQHFNKYNITAGDPEKACV